MANLKDRTMDQIKRLIRRHIRFETCAVDHVDWHKEPNDHNFNVVTVIMRDRRQESSGEKEYYREQLPCLQSFIGHHLGQNWNPRTGDLVRCIFYQDAGGNRRGIILGTTWSWAQKPVCRKSPYDLVNKGSQWIKPYQDPATGDFVKQPYPESKKPYCFKWFHGAEGPDGKPSGDIGPGRDWLLLWDYCHEGHACPDCRNCKDIDCVARTDNHGFKFYSEQTESKKAYPLRGLYFVPSGSYWMFESRDTGCTEGCVSEIYTAGKGFWTIQGAKSTSDLKGHIRHYPDGDMEIHSATSEAENTGVRVSISAPGSTRFDYAYEAIDFATGAYYRLLKNGEVVVHSPSKITLDAPLVEETGNNKIDGSNDIEGSCIHGECSCLGAQDLTSYTKTDPGNSLIVTPTTCTATAMPANASCGCCGDLGVDFIDDLRLLCDLNVSACATGSGCGCCGCSNSNAGDLLAALLKKLLLEVHGSTPTLSLSLYDGSTRIAHSDYVITLGQTYYLELRRATGSNTATLQIYSDQNRETLLTTLTLTHADISTKFRFLYALSSMNSGSAAAISASLGHLTIAKH